MTSEVSLKEYFELRFDSQGEKITRLTEAFEKLALSIVSQEYISELSKDISSQDERVGNHADRLVLLETELVSYKRSFKVALALLVVLGGERIAGLLGVFGG